MDKKQLIYHLTGLLRMTDITSEEREALRAAINTETWVIARRAKQRRNKKMRDDVVNQSISNEGEENHE